MPSKERIAAFIDGNNLYFKLKTMGVRDHGGRQFDYFGFIKWLAGERKVGVRSYYIGELRDDPKEERIHELYVRQQELFAYLASKDQKFNVVRGFLMPAGETFREKGVDVRMAIDMVVGAYEDQYDTAIMVSSDSDLVPAILNVKRQGKQVEYVGFRHEPNHALRNIASATRLLNRREAEQFVRKREPTVDPPAPTEKLTTEPDQPS